MESAKNITIRLGDGVFPFALVYCIASAVPFAFLFVVIVRGGTIYPRFIAFCTPLIVIVCMFLIFHVLLPLNAGTYAAAVGIINEGALVFFTALLITEMRRVRTRRQGV